MKRKHWRCPGIVAFICLIFLILDSKSVQEGVRQGIELLLHAVIPALFPFLLTTSTLNSIMLGKQIPGLQKIAVFCGIPAGAESIFLLGLLAGYPIGAKMLSDAYDAGQLDRSTARRLLGFCNNAGPAFIFGILGPMFTCRIAPFLIWGIHILSAVVVGLILPLKTQKRCHMIANYSTDFSQIIEQCIRTMAIISAWIIIWKIVIAICSRYFLLKVPLYLRVVVIGLCELTNGCTLLPSIGNEAIRFIIASGLLSCGGLCVTMQTHSVTKNLGMGMYFPGKLLQTLVSIALAAVFSCILYQVTALNILTYLFLITGSLICIAIFIIRNDNKIMVAFR